MNEPSNDDRNPRRRRVIAVVGGAEFHRTEICTFLGKTPRFEPWSFTHEMFDQLLRTPDEVEYEHPEVAIIVIDRAASGVISTPPYVIGKAGRVPLLVVRPSGADDDDAPARSDVLDWPSESQALRSALSLGLTPDSNRFASTQERKTLIHEARLRQRVADGEQHRVPDLEVSGQDLLISSSMPPAERIELLREAQDIDPNLELRPISVLSPEVSTLRRQVRAARRLIRDAPGVDARVFPVAAHKNGVALIGSAAEASEARRAMALCRTATGIHPVENLVCVDEEQRRQDAQRAERLTRALKDLGVQAPDVAVSGIAVYLGGRASEADGLEELARHVVPNARVFVDLQPMPSAPSSDLAPAPLTAH